MLIKCLAGFIIGVLLSICIVTPSHAWLIYHKPEFKGKVIDAETKEPIEGAVVVVVYSKSAFRFDPHTISIIVEVKETLTDKEGNFSIPSYTTIIDPLARESHARFIIFKPGYGSFPDGRVLPSKGTDVEFEDFFSKDYSVAKEVLWREPWKVGAESKKIKVTFGIVELPKLKTREERLNKGLPSIPGPGIPASKMKNLIKLSNEERISLGLEPETWP